MPYVPVFPGSPRIWTCVLESVPDAKNVPEIKKKWERNEKTLTEIYQFALKISVDHQLPIIVLEYVRPCMGHWSFCDSLHESTWNSFKIFLSNSPEINVYLHSFNTEYTDLSTNNVRSLLKLLNDNNQTCFIT